MQENQISRYNPNIARVATRPAPVLEKTGPNPGAGARSNRRPTRPGRRLRSWLLIAVLLVLALVLTPFVVVELINTTNQDRIYTSIQTIPSKPVAVVFGAGLQPDGSPSWMLADRLNSAIGLYRGGKVQRLLLTGDEVTSREITAMRNYALRQGVPAAAILTDAAGLRTYDSCYRASRNFGINQAILVTQAYHLPRALYLCNSLGVESVGLKAGIDAYPRQDYYNSREFLATFGSWVDITIIQPKPEIEQAGS